MKLDFTTIIGIVASVFTAIALLPQLFKIFREKSAEGTSWLMLSSLFIGVSSWVIYGFQKNDWIIIVSNMFGWLVNSTIIVLSLIYRKNKSALKT